MCREWSKELEAVVKNIEERSLKQAEAYIQADLKDWVVKVCWMNVLFRKYSCIHTLLSISLIFNHHMKVKYLCYNIVNKRCTV